MNDIDGGRWVRPSKWDLTILTTFADNGDSISRMYVWRHGQTQETRPVRQMDAGRGWIQQRWINRAPPGVFVWLWLFAVLRFADIVWLVAQYDPSCRAYPVWPANPCTVWPWLWAWAYPGIRRVAGPIVERLYVQGVLVLGETERFEFRHVLRYLFRPGHRTQRRIFRGGA